MIPFLALPPAIHRVIYTTNVIESIYARLRKIIKTWSHFLSDDAASPADLAGLAEHQRRLWTSRQGLEGSHEPVRYPLHRML